MLCPFDVMENLEILQKIFKLNKASDVSLKTKKKKGFVPKQRTAFPVSSSCSCWSSTSSPSWLISSPQFANFPLTSLHLITTGLIARTGPALSPSLRLYCWRRRLDELCLRPYANVRCPGLRRALRQVFLGHFTRDEHPSGVPTPFLLCETERPSPNVS